MNSLSQRGALLLGGFLTIVAIGALLWQLGNKNEDRERLADSISSSSGENSIGLRNSPKRNRLSEPYTRTTPRPIELGAVHSPPSGLPAERIITQVRPDYKESPGLDSMAKAVAALRESGAEGAAELERSFDEAAATAGTDDDAIVAAKYHQIRIQHAKVLESLNGSSEAP